MSVSVLALHFIQTCDTVGIKPLSHIVVSVRMQKNLHFNLSCYQHYSKQIPSPVPHTEIIKISAIVMLTYSSLAPGFHSFHFEYLVLI